jgi:quinol monooxygenase YgiN
MVAHIWRMRAKKKKTEAYEKFGLTVTLAALRKIKGCLEAHFMRVASRKPEYLWVVLWEDQDALEAARNNPAWREQIRKFEAGQFYKTIPLELVCQSLGSFSNRGARPRAAKKAGKPDEPETAAAAAPTGTSGPTPEGE